MDKTTDAEGSQEATEANPTPGTGRDRTHRDHERITQLERRVSGLLEIQIAQAELINDLIRHVLGKQAEPPRAPRLSLVQ